MGSRRRKFRAKLSPGGKHGDVAFVQLPFDLKKTWGVGRMPVRLTINAYTFCTSVDRMGNAYCFCVNQSMRKATGLNVGDIAEFVVEPDESPRIVDVPAELSKGLGPDSMQRLRHLAYTHQKGFVRWYTEAKKRETRARRLAKMKDMLLTGKTIS